MKKQSNIRLKIAFMLFLIIGGLIILIKTLLNK